MNIQQVPLHEIARWPRNPKDHDVGTISKSLERFGFIAPMIKDEGTGRLVAGHGRLDALIQRHGRGEAPPRNIDLRADGEWLIPVVCGITFQNPTEALAYLVADNQTTIAGDWTENLLAEALQELVDSPGPGLDATGFDRADLDDMLKRLAGQHDREPRTERTVECPECHARFKV